MMTLVLVLIATSTSGYFLQISPGVVSQGLGGASIVLNEGLPVFHNPAIARGTQFSLVASRWLFSTSMLTASACFDGFSCGISYIDYGAIQGYDVYGNMTHTFNPFSMCIGISRTMGLFGVSIKGFGEKIEAVTLTGACACISTYTNIGRFGFGAKIDNLGREFMQNTAIPYVIGLGMRARIFDALSLIIESKSPDIELNAGIEYTYQNAMLVFGAKYLRRRTMMDDTETG
jgi:hypothetical protein